TAGELPDLDRAAVLDGGDGVVGRQRQPGARWHARMWAREGAGSPRARVPHVQSPVHSDCGEPSPVTRELRRWAAVEAEVVLEDLLPVDIEYAHPAATLDRREQCTVGGSRHSPVTARLAGDHAAFAERGPRRLRDQHAQRRRVVTARQRLDKVGQCTARAAGVELLLALLDEQDSILPLGLVARARGEAIRAVEQDDHRREPGENGSEQG